MPKQHALCIEHKLYPDFKLVFSTLLDLRKFGLIHPYMKEVVLTEEVSSKVKTYFICEEVYFLGLIKTKPQYHATVFELEAGKHIRYTSHVKKHVFLQVDFYFDQPSSKHLIVREEIVSKANYLVGKIFLNIIKKAHLHFFENLKKIFRTSVEDID